MTAAAVAQGSDVTPPGGGAVGALQPETVLRTSRWLALSSVVVGLANYAFSLALTRALAPGLFADFAAAQSLLLVCGTLATSSVPWVVARVLAETVGSPDADARRRAVVWFSLVVNLAQGLVAATVVVSLSAGFLDRWSLLALGLGAVAVFLTTSPGGWLQGSGQLNRLAGLRVIEVLVKLVVGGALVLLGGDDAGALAGAATGALVVVAVGLVLMRHDVGYSPGALKVGRLWRASVGNIGVQGLVAVMASTDVVLVAVLDGGTSESGSYQAATILARVPIFLAGALGVAAFPALVAAASEGKRVRSATTAGYAAVAGTYALALVTAPGPLVGLVFPASYADVGDLLPWIAVAGLLLGAVNLVTTYYQSAERYATAVRLLLAGALAHVGLLFGAWQVAGVHAVAAFSPVVPAVVLVALLVPLGMRLSTPTSGSVARVGLTIAVATGLLLVTRPFPAAWLVVAAVAGALAVRRAMSPSTAPAPDPPGRTRILHLAFEDHRRPGSGGGAYRTHETARRLAIRHDVTVVTTTWRGAQDRVEDGVRYVHLGVPGGYLVEVATYFLLLPYAVRRHRVDVVVEDFAAPISSALVPLYVRGTPVVAVVQWLNADEKAAQYHLPVHLFQRWGLRLHTRFVAVSDGIAERIMWANPEARVTVVPNGVDERAFAIDGPTGTDVVFLGRLEIAQKGIDLLLQAVSRVADRLPGRVLLVGDGPDRDEICRQVEAAGLGSIVQLVGRLSGEDRLRALQAARLCVMPSRFETFGIVAVEAQAVGTPVLAFDIPCLREVVPPCSGVLVPAFDVDALAAAMVALLDDPGTCQRMGRSGREFARRFDWDRVSGEQETVLLDAARRIIPAEGKRA